MLEIRDFVVSAGGRVLFRDLSLTLESGSRVALCGPSGSGKTTLLRAVAGLIDPEKGTLLFRDEAPDDIGWPSYRRRVVLVDQRPVLLAGTVEENLRLPFAYATAGGDEFPKSDALSLLSSFGVSTERFGQEARSLSQGQQQRVCLVRAFLLKPSVLLLDEPTSALDPKAVRSVEKALVTETERRDLAALVVTHDPDQAERLCHRTVDLEDYGGEGDDG
ncbi:MAG: ATP-binding cassette domain-containing protein [Candidatus Aegiribacteria sp.]